MLSSYVFSQVTDYLDIIKQPMDLETMMTKVDIHKYNCAKEFLDDIDLICANALEYNPDRSVRILYWRYEVRLAIWSESYLLVRLHSFILCVHSYFAVYLIFSHVIGKWCTWLWSRLRVHVKKMFFLRFSCQNCVLCH